MDLMKLVSIVFCGLMFGCTTSEVNVSSAPDKADVYLSKEGKPPLKLGQTPLTFSAKDHQLNEGQYTQLIVKKEGYQTESVVIPTSLVQKKVAFSVRLDEFKVPVKCEIQAKDQSKNLEIIASGVARAQLFMQQKNYDQAMNLVMTLISQYPGVSVFHDLAGNIHFLQGRFDKALESYQMSLNIVPDKTETQRMLDRLQNIRGYRLPAGGTQ